jgi:hypothetical protein
MKKDIKIGSMVYGKGDLGNPVTAIAGEMLTINTVKGLRLVNISKILRVEQPPHAITNFKLGDRVQYIGSDFNLKKQYAGTLEVWEISKEDINSYTCLKPNRRVTSWIEFADLQLVEIAQ